MQNFQSLRHKFRGFFRRIADLFLNGVGSRNGKRYESVLPGATYAPWNLDDEFLSCYCSIRQHTLVDKYRCFELWQLVKQTSRLNGAILEVGVWRGGTGALIARRAQLDDSDSTIYLCDTFSGVVKSGPNDNIYLGGEHADATKQNVERLVRQNFNLPNVRVLTGIFPDETGAELAGEEFRFCHIDVDVYQSAKDVLEWIWPKLLVGGVIVYDDYGFPYCEGVAQHVNEQLGRSDALIIHNLNGHAVMIKNQ